MKISANGAVNMPNQPCVIAYNSVTDDNVTGAGGVHTLDYNTEVTDQGGNFLNDIFTAPVTGSYFVTAACRLEGVSTSSSNLDLIVVASNHTWHRIDNRSATGYTNVNLAFSALIDMDANDTVYFQYQGTGESGNTHDVYGATSHHTAFCSITLVA